jgi:predicted nucleic acid-binding protein
MIVVDTNLIGYLLVQSPRSQQAEQILQVDPEWIAPWLWRSELRNVLVQYVRAGHLDLKEAQVLMGRAEAVMRDRDQEVVSRSVLALAEASGCTAYDCEFVEVAQRTDAPLVTVDQQLLTAFPNTAVSPDEYLRSYTSHRH